MRTSKKIGIKEGFNLAIVNPPEGFARELQPLPPGVSINSSSRRPLDCAIFFATSEKELATGFARMKAKLRPNGMLWIAWPKKSSGVSTDLSFPNVQGIGLASGLVDVKSCAVNDVWSGLKFVYRLKDRSKLV